MGSVTDYFQFLGITELVAWALIVFNQEKQQAKEFGSEMWA